MTPFCYHATLLVQFQTTSQPRRMRRVPRLYHQERVKHLQKPRNRQEITDFPIGMHKGILILILIALTSLSNWF
jgi:hypothetical protein